MATVPLARRSLIGAALGALQSRSQARRGRASRIAQAVQDNVMTFAGLAAIDFAAFHVSHGWGWTAVGISVLLADFKLQG